MPTAFIATRLGDDLDPQARQHRLFLDALTDDPSHRTLSVTTLHDESRRLAKAVARPLAAKTCHRFLLGADGAKLRFARAAWSAVKRARRVFCASPACLPLVAAAIRPRARLLALVNESDLLAPPGPFLRRALRRCDLVLCPSLHARDLLLARLPDLAARLRVISPALSAADLGREPPRPPPVDGPPVVLCPLPLHGRHLKAAEHLVLAFARLPAAAFYGQDPLMPRLRFCGEGTGIEPLYRAAVAEHVDARVDFTPVATRAELRAAFARAACCALPDPAGPDILNTLEALAAGRPCVTLARGSATELLSPENSALAETDDPAALAAALAECLVRLRDPAEIWRSAASFNQEQLSTTLATLWP